MFITTPLTSIPFFKHGTKASVDLSFKKRYGRHCPILKRHSSFHHCAQVIRNQVVCDLYRYRKQLMDRVK